MPRPVYRFAMLTTSRRFASSRWFLAARPSVDDRAQVGRQLRRRARCRSSSAEREALLGEQSGLDALGQVDLLLGGEQLGPADAVEVGPDQVGGDARARPRTARCWCPPSWSHRVRCVDVPRRVDLDGRSVLVSAPSFVSTSSVVRLATIARLPVSLSCVALRCRHKRRVPGRALSLGEAPASGGAPMGTTWRIAWADLWRIGRAERRSQF